MTRSKPSERQTLTISEAAAIKWSSPKRVRDALGTGKMDMLSSGEVVWDRRFESWMPKVEAPVLAYRMNLARLFTTTIRISGDLDMLCLETQRRAQAQAATWDIVPVTRENVDIAMAQQWGSIDGNVACEPLWDDVNLALSEGRRVYQTRIHTLRPAYTQGLHPTPPVAAPSPLGSRLGLDLGEALASGKVNVAEYRGARVVVVDETLRSWVEGESNYRSLFSDALMRA